MRKTIALTAAAALTAGLGLFAAGPASAADTSVTFSITGGGLSITAPSGPVILTAGSSLLATGTTVSGQLGSTTVTDARGLLAGSWKVVMTSTDYSDGATPTPHTIPATAATAYSGATTATTGVAVILPTTALVSTSNLGGTGTQILSASATAGGNSATYNPTVSIAVPSTAVATTYTGTITQTVS